MKSWKLNLNKSHKTCEIVTFITPLIKKKSIKRVLNNGLYAEFEMGAGCLGKLQSSQFY